ncbi:hypothetical protein L218DRAFT_951547 [Marasmius fiardii PR-910]|nr:hypothetical protein L218DRAFT_951547 [Marasmius fiardii PR-910]
MHGKRDKFSDNRISRETHELRLNSLGGIELVEKLTGALPGSIARPENPLLLGHHDEVPSHKADPVDLSMPSVQVVAGQGELELADLDHMGSQDIAIPSENVDGEPLGSDGNRQGSIASMVPDTSAQPEVDPSTLAGTIENQRHPAAHTNFSP